MTDDLTIVEQIAALIRRVETQEEMHEVIEIVKHQQGRMARKVARTFSPGDEVEFEGRGGKILRGKVVRLLKKNILVEVGEQIAVGAGDGSTTKMTVPRKWRVHPTFLRPVG